MKALFIIDDVYDPFGATNKLAKELAGELNCEEIQVIVLRNVSKEIAEMLPVKLGVKEIGFFSDAEKRLYEEIASIRQKSNSLIVAALKIFIKPKLLMTAIKLLLFKTSPMEEIFKKEIEKACNEKDIDVAISFSCPHYSSFALANSEIDAKKIAYFMDPYSDNKAMKLLYSPKKESNLLNKIDKLIITEQMSKRVDLNTRLSLHKDKLVTMFFPGIQELCYDKNVTSLKFVEGKINISFIGNFYLDIRKPDFMLELFKSIKNRCDFCLNLIGGGKDAFGKAYWENIKKEFGDSINLVDSVPSSIARNAVFDSDFLINIGNDDNMLLPSKVLEYISSKKPIINTYKIDDCPSLSLLNDYPLALSIKETETIDEFTCDKVLKFIEANRGKICEDISSYDRYNLKSVTKELKKTINQITC